MSFYMLKTVSFDIPLFYLSISLNWYESVTFTCLYFNNFLCIPLFILKCFFLIIFCDVSPLPIYFVNFIGACKLGMRLGWLMYFIVLPNVMSVRCIRTCSFWCNNWRCCIDIHLTFLALSCTSRALSDIFYRFWNWVCI